MRIRLARGKVWSGWEEDVGSVQAQMPMPITRPCSRQARGEEPVFPPGEPRAPVPAPADHAPHPPALLLQRRQGLGCEVPALPRRRHG